MRIGASVSAGLPMAESGLHSDQGASGAFAARLRAAAGANPPNGDLAAAARPLAGSRPDGTVNLEDLRQQSARMLESLVARLRKRLEEAGIDLREEVRLSIDEEGNLRAAGGQRLKEEIEQVLADEPGLAHEFREWAGLESCLAATAHHQEFREAYAADPSAAVNRFAALLAGHREALTLRLDHETAMVEHG